MRTVRVGGLIAAFLLAIAGTGAGVFAWRWEIALDTRGVHGHAVVESIDHTGRSPSPVVAIDGRPPVHTDLSARGVHVGQTIEITYDPRHPSTARRGWGSFGWKPTIPLTLLALMSDGLAVAIAVVVLGPGFDG